MSDDRVRTLNAPSRYRNICTVLATGCAGLALFLADRSLLEPMAEPAAFVAGIEADMLVSRGNQVELYLNDWEHPPERVPLIAGKRRIYRFAQVPHDITLVRLDPSDVSDARFVIYSLTVKAGGRILRTFGPAELKGWNTHNLSAAKEENGGLAMSGTTDDPILWTPLKQPIRLPEKKIPERSRSYPSYLYLRYHWSLWLALAALLLSAPVVRQAGPFNLELLLTALAGSLALWVLATTANVVRLGWFAVPIGDDWDRWLTYVGSHSFLQWLFQQHIDHRIVVPKLLFEVDHFVFRAQGWFTLLCTFCLQALTGLMLWRLSGRVCRQDRTERLILAAVITACLFSAQQWMNFIMPFQVQFPMVYCAAAAALVCLGRGAQQEWQSGAPWVAAAIVAATVATYSMANGVLLWPVLLLAAFWLRMPRRWMAALAACAILLGATYFYHWHKSNPVFVMTLAEHLPRAAVFLLANQGSPLTPIALMFNTDAVRLTVAAIPGALLAAALLTGFGTLWRRRERFNNARAVLMFYCVFLAGSSASMAYGRSDEVLLEAFTSRYLTPSYIFWVSMLLAAWPWLRRWHRPTLYATLCASMFLGIAIHQQNIVLAIRNWRQSIPLGETAVVDNVTDKAGWAPLYHTPRIAMDSVDYMRNHHLSIFLEEWTHWPGIPLSSRFSVDRSPAACQGEFEDAVAIPSPIKPGWRVTGWAWDVKIARAPRYVILADDTGRVAGVALSAFPQPVVAGRHLGLPWAGYVDGQRRPITAYVVESDERSLCAIGTQPLPRATREAAFSQVGPLFPEAKPEITGAWTPDAYYKGLNGPGAPPTEGTVYGSFPDSNTGAIQLGPFHLDGHTEMAIPLVSGPDNQNLSIVVRDAATKEVLAKMDPPPVQITWWVWHPELPLDREVTVEIFAEDKGPGWGQWLAVGWPHKLK